MKPIILLLLMGYGTIAAFGQRQNNTSTETFNLFGKSTIEAAEKEYEQVVDGSLMTIDLEELRALREAAPNRLTLKIPVNEEEQLELFLGQINIFSEDFEVKTSRGAAVGDLDLGIHYKGVVMGHSPSLVAVSVYENHIVALISDGHNDYELSRLNGATDRYIIYKTADIAQGLKDQMNRFTCHTETSGRDLPVYTNDQLFGVSSSRMDCKVIQVYLVADFSYYQVLSSDLQETVNRLTSVFAQTMIIYDAESINMVMSGTFVWDSEDSFDESGDAEVQRNQFRDYYNGDGAGWPGDLAQLISGTGGSGASGIAFFNGLCTNDSYAITRAGVNAPIEPWTSYSRFVKVLTHEIGHNLDSRHTHACVWNGDNTQIDDYGNVDTGGAAVDDPEGEDCLELPAILNVTPRIMSYFDSFGHGTFNMTNGMGTQSGNVMRNYVDGSACLDDGSNVPPVALCQDVTVQLNASGAGATTAAAVDNGSYDACGDIQSILLSQTNFSCADVGENEEFILVTDLDGNFSFCFVTITVEDNIAPAAVCRDVTVQLDANGNGSTTAAAVNNGSSDACNIQSLSLSQTNFGCNEIGANSETLTVTDVNGNSSNCSTIVTVEDNIPPTAICFDPTVELQPNGLYTLLESDIYDAINSDDNCSISSVSFPGVTYTCDDAYQTFPVVVTIEDPSGNMDDCTAMVTVEVGKALPPEWTANDIGDQGDGSNYEYDPCVNDDPSLGDFTISTGGYNLIPQNEDNLAFASVPLCGNGGIQARIRSVTGGYAGLMIRESSAPGSKMLAVYSNLTNLLRKEIRTVENGQRNSSNFYASFPEWLRLVRQGDLIRAFYRNSNGGSWQLFHQAYLPMDNCVEMGLAVFTTDPSGDATAVFGLVRYLSQGGALVAPAGNGMEWEAESIPVGRASIQPNPVQNTFTLHFNAPLQAEGEAVLLNEFGQRVSQQPLRVGETHLGWNAERLPAGLYFMEIFTDDGYREVLKVVRQ